MAIYQGNEGLIQLIKNENQARMKLACGEVYIEKAVASLEVIEEPMNDDNVFHVKEDLTLFSRARVKPDMTIKIPLAGIVIQVAKVGANKPNQYVVTDANGKVPWEASEVGDYDVRMLGIEDPLMLKRILKVVA